MSKPVKAALLSALVYPGAGHFFLKKYTMCALFACAFTLPLYFIVGEIIAKAELIVAQIENGEIPLDIVAISNALTALTNGVDAQELNIKAYMLFIIWFIAIIDSYRIGRVKLGSGN